MSGTDGPGQGEGAPGQSAAWIDPDAPAGEVRIGESRRVKGGAKVSAFTEDAAAADEAADRGGRVLSESEVAESGLLQERVIEIGEMREEAVVSKRAVVREELVIRKDVEERTERVSETLRRTEVDVGPIEVPPDPAGGGEEAGEAQVR
jgi:stress response protein YsnF